MSSPTPVRHDMDAVEVRSIDSFESGGKMSEGNLHQMPTATVTQCRGEV
jgi:hypothetical protein